MSTDVTLSRTVTDYLPCLVSIAAPGVSTTKSLGIRLSLMQRLHLQLHIAWPSDLREMAGKWQMVFEKQFSRLAGPLRMLFTIRHLAHALHCA